MKKPEYIQDQDTGESRMNEKAKELKEKLSKPMIGWKTIKALKEVKELKEKIESEGCGFWIRDEEAIKICECEVIKRNGNINEW